MYQEAKNGTTFAAFSCDKKAIYSVNYGLNDNKLYISDQCQQMGV